MKRPSNLVEVLRTLPALPKRWPLSAALRRSAPLWAVGAIAAVAAIACGETEQKSERSQLTGEQLFSLAFPGAANQRSCATCHVAEDNFTLTPAHVTRLLQENPNDPLFNAIDADDPSAEKLTFEHLKKGLVRVWLTLPANVDVIDDHGKVITPSDRKIFVWRGVPAVADSALTAPYQLDGRMKTLEDQAQSAITSHSQGGEAPATELQRIAEFQRGLFTSDRARTVGEALARGIRPEDIPDVENGLVLSPEEGRGREVYKAVCENCHGGTNEATIVDRAVHDLAFPVLKPDGTVLFQAPATDPATPVLAAHPNNEFLNIGSAFETFLGQLDPDSEVYTKDVSFPTYRFRFYTDASRKEVAADLPPIPESDFSTKLDSDGNPIVGPNFGPQLFSADPGRAMITGNPYDFEGFDVPTLRGIGKTAPYFHNNAAATLEKVVQIYSDHQLSKFPSLTLPGEKEPDPDGDQGPPEALTRQHKSDLVAFLKRL